MEQAKLQCKGFNIIIQKNNLFEEIVKIIKKNDIKRLGIEEDFMTVGMYEEFKSKIKGIELVPAKKIFSKMRIIKDKDEIETMSKAAKIADDAFRDILKFIKPGIREMEIALELEYNMKKNGASSVSFESIVASGLRSSMPHGTASEKKIENREFLTLDFGCVYNGYCSDMTRTVFIGKAEEKHKKIFNIVLKAQMEAFNSIRPGMTGKAVDKIARDIITKEGFGEYFGHGLGHGVGLAIHEEPRLSVLSEDILEPGMVVTDEPGIYIPGFGGVRIEDMLLVTETGAMSFTKSPKEFIEI